VREISSSLPKTSASEAAESWTARGCWDMATLQLTYTRTKRVAC
jgi:hypothetical protein